MFTLDVKYFQIKKKTNLNVYTKKGHVGMYNEELKQLFSVLYKCSLLHCRTEKTEWK